MVFIALFGIFSGAVIGLPPASMAFILGSAPHRQAKLGQWTGMMYTVAGVPSLVGPIVAGSLVSRTGAYLPVQLWSGACLMLSAACMAVTVLYKRREAAAELTTVDGEDGMEEEEMGEEGYGSVGRSISAGNVSSRTVSSGVSSVQVPLGDERGDHRGSDEDEAKKAKDDSEKE